MERVGILNGARRGLMSGAERDGILRNHGSVTRGAVTRFIPRRQGNVCVCPCGVRACSTRLSVKRARSRGAISPSSKGVDEALATPSDRGSQ